MASTASRTGATRPLMPRRTALITTPKRETPSAAVTSSPASADLRRAYHRNVEVLYLLAQRIAIEPQEAGRAQLIPRSRTQREGEERPLHLRNDTIVHPVGWQTLAVGAEQCLQMPVDRVGQGGIGRQWLAGLRARIDRSDRVGEL